MGGVYPDTSRPAPRPTRLPVQWGKGCLPGEKRPGRGIDQPPILAPTSVMDRAIPLPPGSAWRVTGQPDFYINKFMGLPHRSFLSHVCTCNIPAAYSFYQIYVYCYSMRWGVAAPPPWGWGESCGIPGSRVEAEKQWREKLIF